MGSAAGVDVRGAGGLTSARVVHHRRNGEALAMRVAPLLLLPLLSACALFGARAPRYAVFFPERSAQLDAAAQGVVAQAAGRARDDPGARVRVVGYTDSAGSPQADVALSRQRAQAVADALAADGVAASRIVRAGRGQTGEDPGVASRRVEISVGGGP
jgi:OmpA family